MNVVVVDLGMGNLRSVERSLQRVGVSPRISSLPDEIERADALVLPGQGAFAGAADALASPLGAALKGALGRGVPYFGICLGMQVLFDASEESPGHAGLGVIAGQVRRLQPGEASLKVPHMGWNRVQSRTSLIDNDRWFYFVHSYHCVPDDPGVGVATAQYGFPLVAAVRRGSVFACQFHPEKSQDAGEAVFTHFFETVRAES